MFLHAKIIGDILKNVRKTSAYVLHMINDNENETKNEI